MKLKEVLVPLLESFKDAKKKFSGNWPQTIVDSTLEDFKSIRKRLSPPENDISYWIKHGFYPFYLTVQREKHRKTKRQQRKEIKTSKDYETIYESDAVDITVPFTVDAACKVGQEGNWCVSTRNMDENQFRNYSIDDGKVYFIFNVDWDGVNWGEGDEYDTIPTIVSKLSIFTLEIHTKTGEIVLWDQNNRAITYKSDELEDFNRFLYLLTQDDMYDHEYFVQKADELHPEIVEALESEDTHYFDDLLERPYLGTIREHLNSLEESAEEVLGSDYDRLAEMIILFLLNDKEHAADLEIVGMFAATFGVNQEVTEGIIKGVLNGDYSAYDIKEIEDGMFAVNADSPSGHEFFHDVVSGAFHDVAEQYIETGEGFDTYLEFIEEIDFIQQDIDDEEVEHSPENVLKQRMYNAPEDETILEDDFAAVVDSRMVEIDEDELYETLVAIRDRRLKYGDTSEHPELDLSYTTLYTSPSGDKVVKALDPEEFSKQYGVSRMFISASLIVLTELGAAVILKPRSVTYWSRGNGDLTGEQLRSMAAQSDAIRWALEYIKNGLLDISEITNLYGFVQRLELILQHIKQGIFVKDDVEIKNTIIKIAEKITEETYHSAPSESPYKIHRIIDKYIDSIHEDALVALLTVIKNNAIAVMKFDPGKMDNYHRLLFNVKQEGHLDEQTINSLRIKEEENNNEI